MNEKIDLETAFEIIQNYAINSFSPSASYGFELSKGPDGIAKHSDFNTLPPSIFNKIPEPFLLVYDEKTAASKWKNIAEAYFMLVANKDTRVEVARLMRALLEFWDLERKFMYKGKDGKDYTSSKEAELVNEFYSQQENPTIDKGRSR